MKIKMLPLAIGLALAIGCCPAAEPGDKFVQQLEIGHRLFKQGAAAAAKEVFAHVATADAVSPFARSEAQVWLGHVLRREGDWDKAIKAYAKVIYVVGANPHHVSEARVWLGQVYFDLGNYQAARSQFKSVLAMGTKVSGHHKQAQQRLQDIAKREKRV